MNNIRILQLPYLQTYVCTIQLIQQLIEQRYCDILGIVKHCTTTYKIKESTRRYWLLFRPAESTSELIIQKLL